MTTAPVIDPRDYQQLLDEALARIPVHNPEWTNFNRSDPGVTLVELFSFLTEALAFRANQIPERNRQKFLSLLGVPVAPASSARGIVELANERGPLTAITVDQGLELRAGAVPFRTELGLDLLPVQGRAFVKQPLQTPPAELVQYYRELYASHRGQHPELKDVQLYRSTPLESFGQTGAALQQTADNSLWIALLLRESDNPPTEDVRRRVREELAGKTLSLGIVPVLADSPARLAAGAALAETDAPLVYQFPQPPENGILPQQFDQRGARYRVVDGRPQTNVLVEPGIVQIQLPDDPAALQLWVNLDPLEAGAGDFPPSLEDTKLEPRVVTWLRMRAPSGAQASILWAGINAVTVTQRAHVAGEVLPPGTGEPDQVVRLARTPVIPGTVSIQVTPQSGEPEFWHEIDDLFAAGPEVPVRDPRTPPGTPPPPKRESAVFVLDPASGEVRFGDGARGRRPPEEALRADYDYGAGAVGNVGPGSIATAPALPAGIKVSNPVSTWGGAEAETVAEGEKQASRYLQHRDRLVTVEDFEAIARRTPGIELGRVEVLPTFNPQLAPPAPTAGSVTLLAIPKTDALHPTAPEPDTLFLNAICRYLDPRRLVTTEVFLRGPEYVDLWVSVGIEVEAGRSVAIVREEVRKALARFLAPIDPDAPGWFEDELASLAQDLSAHPERGWPLGKAVQRLELVAVASRVTGVQVVNDVKLAAGSGAAVDSVPISGLQLPRVRAIAVGPNAGDLDQVRGQAAPDAPPGVVPVPVIPETC